MSSEYVIYRAYVNHYSKNDDKILCKTYDKECADLIVDALSRLEDSANVNYFYKIEYNYSNKSKSENKDLGCGA